MSAAEFYYRQLNQPDEEPVTSQVMTSRSQGPQGPVPNYAAGGSVGAIAGGGNSASASDGMSSLDFLERTALDAQLSSCPTRRAGCPRAFRWSAG